MATQEFMERYEAGRTCIECCAPVKPGEFCGECDAEDRMARNLGLTSSDPKSTSYIPPVLQGVIRESLPEDRSEPPNLPENAGRHQAPEFDDLDKYPEGYVQRVPPVQSGITDNARDLQQLRGARAFPRPR